MSARTSRLVVYVGASVVVLAVVGWVWSLATTAPLGSAETGSAERVDAALQAGAPAAALDASNNELAQRSEIHEVSEDALSDGRSASPEPSNETPGANAADRVRWKKQIERRLAATASDPQNVDLVHDLVTECVLAELELKLDFTQNEVGTPTPWATSKESQIVMRSGPRGSRSYSIRRAEHPLYFEVVRYFDGSRPDAALLPPNSVPRALAGRVEGYAKAALERLQ